MVYTSVSMKEIMAMVIRYTRVKDTSYIIDMDEWIADAMSLMRTKVVLSKKWQDVIIEFHKGLLPHGIRSIMAVECNGHRIPKGNSVRVPDAPQTRRLTSKGTTNGFEFVPQYYYPPNPDGNPQEQGQIPTWDLKSISELECNTLPCLEGAWYDTELPNIISMNIPQCKVRVHYRAIPCDPDGLPLIPDNGDYKLACYFYVRGCMIGAGWEDPIFKYGDIMHEGSRAEDSGMFWKHAIRAMSSIKYPSVDSMEFKVNEYTRLIKDNFYFDNFFSSPNQERVYGYDSYMYNLSPGTPHTYKDGNPNQTSTP